MAIEPWQALVLAGLTELRDAQFQERVWLRREGESVSSPADAVCQVFDDTGLSALLEDPPVFSGEADILLRRMSQKLDRMNLEQPVVTLLASSDWREIRNLAAQAQAAVQRALGL